MAEEDVQMAVEPAEEAKVQSVEGSDAKMVEEGGEEDKERRMKAVKQIEFYFADANLPYDRFMWTLHTKDPEHWVPVDTVASFKRMREFSSLGVKWLAESLRLSEELEVNEGGTQVRRRTEVQEPKDQFQRSVYAKGFPDEDSTLQSKLETFFNKYGKTNAVRMRRDEAKKFKNSVFAEFADFESIDTFLNADPKPTWDGKELLIMSKEAYCEMKIKEKGLTGRSAQNRKSSMMSTPRGGFNAFREMAKAKSASSTSQDKSSSEPKKDVFLEFMGTKIKIQEDEEGNGTVKAEEVPFVRGATLRFEGCGGSVLWSDIKDPIKEKFDGRPPYIKYARGEDSGLVGFHKALTEEDITTVKDAIKTLNSNPVTWTVPEESEEKEFQIERAQAAAKAALGVSSHGVRGKGRRGGRGGGGGGRGRGGGGGGRGGGRGAGRSGGSGRGGRDDRGGTKRGGEAAKEGGSGEEAGEKRKRAVEPDGGPDVGVRGNTGPPVLQTAKKAKTEGEGGNS